ncbi:hypothetical protein QBC46DRAFT_449231 [Diplogelasinospora grovesii]|uniref:Uncharacterized protein n=1 Tax=Diplogelasinospora grovesii TaxID=303347 RepID=A0AAN6N8R8_9PEZI|nr:hypothetical protein QBC46DRAFT_449231 [Diplogelasinospora grovesii]
MFPGLPPLVRVALRGGRKGAFLGSAISALLVLVLYHHHEYFGSGSDTVQKFSVIQLDPTDAFSLRESNRTARRFLIPPPLPSEEALGLPVSVPGVPKAVDANESYTRALVIARTKSEEVDWIHEPLDSPSAVDATEDPNSESDERDVEKAKTVADEWDVHIYTTDTLAPETGYHTPVNKGREAMAYLTYIVTNYDRLPDVTLFMHAHRSSWHDNLFGLDAINILRDLNLDRVVRMGYMNLRCSWDPGCPSHIHPENKAYDVDKPEQQHFEQAWGEIFAGQEVPEVLSQPCCAQIALTRERIHTRGVHYYVGLRDWLLNTELKDSISGRVMEYLYQDIWTGEPVHCPEEHECYCDAYSICFSGRDDFREFVDRRDEWQKMKEKVDEFVNDRRNVFGAADVLELLANKQDEDYHRNDTDTDTVDGDSTENAAHDGDRKGESKDVEEDKRREKETSLYEMAVMSKQSQRLEAWLNVRVEQAKERGRETRLPSLPVPSLA